MSNASFTFPPPPPPPPRRATESAQHNQGRGAPQQLGRGRGDYARFLNHSRPRGLGGFGSRGRGSNFETTRDLQKDSQLVHTQSTPRYSALSPVVTKRPFDAAFVQHKPGHTFSDKIPPDASTYSQPSANIQSSHQSPPPVKKRRGLGLIHNADEMESEDEDDEEAALTGNGGNELSVEYKGSTSTLRTPADVAAWIAERKRKYPTAAKRETARKEAEEKRKIFEAEKEGRREAAQAARLNGQKERPGKSDKRLNVVQNVDGHAGLRSKKHTTTSLNARTDRNPAENEMVAAATVQAPGTLRQGKGSDVLEATMLDSASVSSFSSDSDATSSSGSETDEDTAPDVATSKVESGSIAAEQATKVRQVCHFFAKHGRCKWGSRCKHRHEHTQATRAQKAKTGPVSTKRKGLWQVMVEKEQEEDSKKILHAIVALGRQGLLDEPTK